MSNLKKNFLDLPSSIIFEVFSYLSYEKIAELRVVNKKIREYCEEALNHGFQIIMEQQRQVNEEVKALTPPRKEREKDEALYTEMVNKNDMTWVIEVRVEILEFTMRHYIDQGLCCFMYGKFLDEVSKLLGDIRYRRGWPRPPSFFLYDMRDLSSMAVYHFYEKVVPRLHLLPCEELEVYREPDSSEIRFKKLFKNKMRVYLKRRPEHTRLEVLRFYNEMKDQWLIENELDGNIDERVVRDLVYEDLFPNLEAPEERIRKKRVAHRIAKRKKRLNGAKNSEEETEEEGSVSEREE